MEKYIQNFSEPWMTYQIGNKSNVDVVMLSHIDPQNFDFYYDLKEKKSNKILGTLALFVTIKMYE